MSDHTSGEFADWADDNPYRSPSAPLQGNERSSSRARPLRWALIWGLIGAVLGLAVDLTFLFLLLSEPRPGEDDSIGPMVVAMLAFLAAAVIVCGAVLGFCFGLLSGTFAAVMAPPNTRPALTGRLKDSRIRKN